MSLQGVILFNICRKEKTTITTRATTAEVADTILGVMKYHLLCISYSLTRSPWALPVVI